MKDEFKLIEKLLKYAPQNSGQADFPVRVPGGDDACLLSSIKNPVITTDTQKEGIHFRFDWQTPEQVGMKAVASTLSDLAASFARPLSFFVNVSIPPSVQEKILEDVYSGIQKALVQYNCTLGGGNISSGRELSFDLFAIGEGKDDLFPVRSGASSGDGIYCTGPLGLSAAGLDALKRGDTSFERLISCFKMPKARFDAASVLADNRVMCVTDISDGLSGDAEHIAKASGVTIELFVEPEHIDVELASYCKKYGLKAENVVLSGGEDYELLFACNAETYDAVKKTLPDVRQMGRCLPFTGEHLMNLPSGVSSFQHGKGA